MTELPDENEAEMPEKAPDDEGEEESDNDEDEIITEIRFVPSDKAACECMHLDWCFHIKLTTPHFIKLHTEPSSVLMVQQLITKLELFALNDTWESKEIWFCAKKQG